jgi:butyrate kinase
MSFKILALNPGSTSTKLAVFEDEKVLFEKTLRHSAEELLKYKRIYDQLNFRIELVLESLKENEFDIKDLDAIVGRGGVLRPIESGTYSVNERMLEDLKTGVQGEHASNLGGLIAHAIANEAEIPSYIVDPVVVDELSDVARISGMPEIKRISIFHALNQKAVAKRYAKEIGRNYEDLNLIVVHLGGGISVGAHIGGRVVEVNNALTGDGPFSPERSGGVPVGDLVKMCYSGKYTKDEMNKKINGKGGFVAYLDTNDFREVAKKAENDKYAKLIYDAFIYQIGKEIGKCAAVLRGNVDAIILTGGIAYSKAFTDALTEMVSFISKIVIYPGEDELLALALGGLRVLKGEEKAKVY